MARGHVEYLRIDELARGAYALHPTATGLRGTLLSADPETGAETVLVDAAQLWRWDEPCALSFDVEVLVLDGALAIAGETLARGDYLWLPAGADPGTVAAAEGARFLWMPGARVSPAARLHSQGPSHVRRLLSMPWLPSPPFEGRPAEQAGPGLGVKIVREDPVTGAYTLLTRHAPGWSDPRLESHDTWEELLLLDGDYLMGTSGVVAAGTYIFRPGARPHGPQASRHGAVWFCRGERRIDFKFSQPAWTAGHVQAYFAAPPTRAPSAPFGPWS